MSAQRRDFTTQDRIYRWLKQHVASMPRDEGVFLTEAEVVEATEASRTPVREAFLRLEAEGFLQIVPKKGAFVPPIGDSEVRAVMEARAVVEDWCVRQNLPADAGLLGELDQLIADQESLLDDPVGYIECDRVFHRTIVQQANNAVLTQFYESLRERQLRMGLRAVVNDDARARNVLAEHRAIVAALRSGDPEQASAAVATHLSSTLKTLQIPGPPRLGRP